MRRFLSLIACAVCLILPAYPQKGAPVFDLCIQQDGSGSPHLLIDQSRGAFTFDDCAGLSLGGTANKYVLSECDTRYNADFSSGGRFYKLRVFQNTCSRKATVKLYEDGALIRTVEDSDYQKGNTCQCDP